MDIITTYITNEPYFICIMILNKNIIFFFNLNDKYIHIKINKKYILKIKC